MTRRDALLSGLSSAALFGCSPAGLLNGFSRITGDSARLAGGGASFGGDPRLKLDVWAPNRRSSAPLPVVVFFYGGGWVSGERGEYGFVGRAFAFRFPAEIVLRAGDDPERAPASEFVAERSELACCGVRIFHGVP